MIILSAAVRLYAILGVIVCFLDLHQAMQHLDVQTNLFIQALLCV